MPSVAVVGASADRSKFGNKAVRAYVRQGWTVYPVHPKLAEIEGLRAYASVRDLPGDVQRIALYLPPEVGLTVLPDLVRFQSAELFVNPGADSDTLIDRAQELGLDPIQACAIVDVGESPSTL
ncbi:MAG TPA: CoA-binding protein [Planctomycetota bacterium]|nr:CoA-binding protein [Planctomycetota bacterium]